MNGGETRQIPTFIYLRHPTSNGSTKVVSHNAMAESMEVKTTDNMDTSGPGRVFDDEHIYLLERSIVLALEHIGFDGASKEALESFRGEVDSC
jgi:hypothetical protein